MNFKMIALTTAFALSSSLAFAQAGGANGAGATVPESSGTAVNRGGGAVGTVENGRMVDPAAAPTTGMSRSGPTRDGGGRDASRPGGEGVSRKPAD